MKKTILGCALVGCCLAGLTSPAEAKATGGFCPTQPSGFSLWDVNAEPYHADNTTDELGNNDGLVCAKPWKTVHDEDGNPFQLYVFVDDAVPVSI
jgi:hypothetical protein